MSRRDLRSKKVFFFFYFHFKGMPKINAAENKKSNVRMPTWIYECNQLTFKYDKEAK